MIEVLRTNDPVLLNFAQAVLRDADIGAVTLDAETASMYGGAVPWIKRRILVADEDADQAKRVLSEALPKDTPRD